SLFCSGMATVGNGGFPCLWWCGAPPRINITNIFRHSHYYRAAANRHTQPFSVSGIAPRYHELGDGGARLPVTHHNALFLLPAIDLGMNREVSDPAPRLPYQGRAFRISR